MASIKLKDYTPKQQTRISKKLSQRKADLKQTQVKLGHVKTTKGLGEGKHSLFKYTVKQGGTPRMQGTLEYDTSKIFSPEKMRHVKVKPRIHVEGAYGVKQPPKEIKPGKYSVWSAFEHDKAKNRVSKKAILDATREVKKSFPKATVIAGDRITGAKAGRSIQKLNLGNIAKTVGRVGRVVRKGTVMGIALDALDLPKHYKTFKAMEKAKKNLKKYGRPEGGQL